MFNLWVVAFGLQISREQYEMIEHLLPKQRGNVAIDSLTVLNAILYVAVKGCTRRGIPSKYERWHTLYTHMSRWANASVLDRMFEELQLLNVLCVKSRSSASKAPA